MPGVHKQKHDLICMPFACRELSLEISLDYSASLSYIFTKASKKGKNTMKKLSRLGIISILFFFPFAVASAQSLNSVHAWAYQLDAINPDEIAANTTFDLIVMDYSADGTPERAFSRQQISAIENSGKIVLAYLSIGEAEDYRFYWQSEWQTHSPAWLGPENPNWPGNYKVRFWNPDWQKIIFSYVDTLLDRGFNGLYCDIIDAYYYWREENPEQPLADSLMVQFLADIRQHVQEKTSAPFFIFPQNGEALIQEEHISNKLRALYWNTIDGIGVEDVFCPGDADENNPFAPDTERLNYLQKFLAHGKLVLSVEYLTEPALTQRYVEAARAAHFIPYASTRDLNRLFDGISTFVPEKTTAAPTGILLCANYPNPFNLKTTFRFFLPREAQVRMEIFDAGGKPIFRRSWRRLPRGLHAFRWNADALSSGLYFYRLRTSRQSVSGKALLLK